MKILKRNQLIILVISLMLITAGYLNFTSKQENIPTSTIADRDDLTIGDAQFVSTIPEKDEENKVHNLIKGESMENQSENQEDKNETIDVPVYNEIQNDNSNTEDYYFTTSKLDRNMMYSELLETYQELYNNINATQEAKTEALVNISKINSTKNAIMIAENLIQAKNFEDVVIFVNEESVSVVIKANELKDEQVAQIQNIVSRELNVGVEKIHISNK